jgi:heme exporter protein C
VIIALAGLAAVLFASALVAAFIIAPPEMEMGDVQRIFYFHVSSAWTAFLAFFLVFASSIAYLRTRAAKWDILANSAAEIGIVFTSVTLLSGSIWARSAWGAWWTWEPRLTTTLMLCLIYVAYLLLREMADDPERRGVFAAVFGIAAFADVPIVFMSVRWWRSLHPAVVTPEGFNMDSRMLPALFLSLAAFTALFAYLLLVRAGMGRSEFALAQLRQRLYSHDEGTGEYEYPLRGTE